MTRNDDNLFQSAVLINTMAPCLTFQIPTFGNKSTFEPPIRHPSNDTPFSRDFRPTLCRLN